MTPPDALGAPGRPVIDTLVIQPTPFCNIECTYCYLPHRRDRSVMTKETLHALFGRVFESGWAASPLTVIWHAGEPLVLPVAWYRDAFDRIEDIQPAELCLRHSIQTNGMLITPEWCRLFKQYQVGIGVSLDGPRHLHDAHRLTRSGRGTFHRTMAGIRLLRQHAVPFHVITVLSAASLNDPDGLVDLSRAIARGVEACRRSCEYFAVCGGGVPINKLTENGSFASERTRFCELTHMVPTDVILEALERVYISRQSHAPLSLLAARARLVTRHETLDRAT